MSQTQNHVSEKQTNKENPDIPTKVKMVEDAISFRIADGNDWQNCHTLCHSRHLITVNLIQHQGSNETNLPARYEPGTASSKLRHSSNSGETDYKENA